MGNLMDRAGQKFNKWTIISFDGLTNGGESRWLCRCDCGFEKVLTIGNVTGGYSRQCKSCSVIRNYVEGTIPTPVWKTILKNAQNRGRLVGITKEFAEDLFIQQNKKCAISGLDIVFVRSNKEYVQGLQTASLDRINSAEGYKEDNVQWVHKSINMMKNNLIQGRFIELCRLVASNNQ